MAKNADDTAPAGVVLTLEDLALLADGTGNIPDDTAVRLRVLICCSDIERICETWRRQAAELERLRRLAAAAHVAELADGLYIFRCLERLRSSQWSSPGEVLDPRLDVPYAELISMARYFAGCAKADEQAELTHLAERLELDLARQPRRVPQSGH